VAAVHRKVADLGLAREPLLIRLQAHPAVDRFVSKFNARKDLRELDPTAVLDADFARAFSENDIVLQAYTQAEAASTKFLLPEDFDDDEDSDGDGEEDEEEEEEAAERRSLKRSLDDDEDAEAPPNKRQRAPSGPDA
jgi:hypothetical protein